MNRGKLQQLGTPEDIYRQPANSFVGSFIGRANFMTAIIDYARGDRVGLRVVPSGASFEVGAAQFCHVDGNLQAGKTVRMMVRPEDLRLSIGPGDASETLENVLPAKFVAATFLGDHHLIEVKLSDGGTCLIKGAQQLAGTHLADLRSDDAVSITWPSTAAKFFPDEALS